MRLFRIFHKQAHKHYYDIEKSIERGEIKVGLSGGRHTSFMLLECKCGDKLAFPSDNFNLALNEGTDETKKFLKNLGAHV